MARESSPKPLVVGVMLALFAAAAGAQVTETPAAFDSAGRVRTLTPAVVTRLQLTAPTWPVQGAFREARLFSLSSGGTVLAVERATGTVDRYPLTNDALVALRSAVDAGVTRTGRIVTEAQADVISQSARGAFVRNQMLLSLLLYSPALAAQSTDAKASTALYLLSSGASYFVVTSMGRRTTVTRAQNDLATDGAIRFALFADGALAVFGPDEPSQQAGALVTLAGALGGSVAGFKRARGLTDGEAKAAKSASTYALMTTGGLLGIAGASDSSNERATTAAVIGAGITGYLLGPSYPRHARYSLTAGDINTLWIGSTLGVASAFIPLVGRDSISDRMGWTAFTAGLVGGAVLADRFWARPYDHTQGDVAQIWLGSLGGALIGGGVVVLAEPGDRAGYSLVTASAALGAIAAERFVRQSPARSASASLAPARGSHIDLEWSPTAIALAASGVRGNHGLLTVRF